MGLLRGVARTAVVAGTATAVSNRVSRRQQQRWAPHGATTAAPQPGGDDLSAQLDRLSELRDQGRLSEEEYRAAKGKLLGL